MNDSSNQSQQMIHETQRLANTAESQLRETIRPWVALEDPSKNNVLLEFSDGIPHANITFTPRNEGGSPAFQFIVNTHLITHPITEPERIGQDMYIRECEDWNTLSGLALNKGQTILSHRDKSMTVPITGREGEQSDSSSSSEIYLIGFIAYNDSRGTSKENTVDQKNAPRYATVFYEQFVRDDGERQIPHTGKFTGKFDPIFTSSYR